MYKRVQFAKSILKWHLSKYILLYITRRQPNQHDQIPNERNHIVWIAGLSRRRSIFSSSHSLVVTKLHLLYSQIT